MLVSEKTRCYIDRRVHRGGGGGGSPLPMNPPRSFKFRFKFNGICMRAHCARARFRDRSAVFHRMRMHACDVHDHSTFKDLIVAERARPCSSSSGIRGGELLTVWARSGRFISVQNGEHSFCSKRRHDEEKSFNGHSFLPAKRGASSVEPPFFWSLGVRGKNQ